MALKLQRPPRQLLAICGMLAPTVYTIATFAAGAGNPGYSQSRQFVSELGATGAPTAALMNYGGFLLFGLFMTAFAVGVHRGIKAEAGDALGAALLIIVGMAYVLLAFSPCDPGCRGSPGSLHHRAHFLLSDLILFAATATPLTLFSRLKRDGYWTRWAWCVAVAAVAAWIVFELPLSGLPAGVRQRLWLLLNFTWIEVLAFRLFRRGDPASSTAAQTSGQDHGWRG